MVEYKYLNEIRNVNQYGAFYSFRKTLSSALDNRCFKNVLLLKELLLFDEIPLDDEIRERVAFVKPDRTGKKTETKIFDFVYPILRRFDSDCSSTGAVVGSTDSL